MARQRVKVGNGARDRGEPCVPKITIGKGGARSCSTCGAKAATAKTIMLCARTGRLPGVKA